MLKTASIEITNNETKEIITNQTIKLCTGNDYIFNTEVIKGKPIYNWTFNNIKIEGSQNLKALTLNILNIHESIMLCKFNIRY